MSPEQNEVWQLVREGNRAWVSGAARELASLYDEHAVVITPGMGRVEGREAIVKSYEDYLHHARTHSFEELEHSVEVFGDLAMATYRFAVRYTPAGEDGERDEAGQEILALRRTSEGWKVIWRTQIAA